MKLGSAPRGTAKDADASNDAVTAPFAPKLNPASTTGPAGKIKSRSTYVPVGGMNQRGFAIQMVHSEGQQTLR